MAKNYKKNGSHTRLLADLWPNVGEKAKIFKLLHRISGMPQKVHPKFQVPSMFAVQINVPFVSFHYQDLKVLHVLYLQANPDFQKIITQARNSILHPDFCIFHISKSSLKKLCYLFLDPSNSRGPPVALMSLYIPYTKSCRKYTMNFTQINILPADVIHCHMGFN